MLTIYEPMNFNYDAVVVFTAVIYEFIAHLRWKLNGWLTISIPCTESFT